MKPINIKPILEAKKAVSDTLAAQKYAAQKVNQLVDRYGDRNDHGEQGMIAKVKAEHAATIEHTFAAMNALDKAKEPLAEAIKAAEGRSTARTITVDNIVECLEDIEKELSISKAAMNGITVSVDINSQHFPGAYKYIPESTHFHAIYKNGSWRITDIFRGTCRQGHHIEVTHTEESRKAILDRLTKF